MIILWVILFILIVAISFVLAIRSMKDFAQTPQSNDDYSLFLIRNVSGLNGQLLNSIRANVKSALNISFERLFKGKKSALVVFGPRKPLLNYKDSLDLLELEDYTNVNAEHISCWEVAIKNNAPSGEKLFINLPEFSDTEQFFWQVIFSNLLQPQIRAVVVSDDNGSRDNLTQALQNISPKMLTRLPKAFSNAQLLDFYQKRSFVKSNKNRTLSPEQILQLLF